MTKKWKLTHWIMLGMILGIVVGYACHQYAADEATAKAIAADFGVVTTIFLHMVKMIIAPLVFATLVSGIASMDSGKSIGRIGAKVLGWFIVASSCRSASACCSSTSRNPVPISTCRCRQRMLRPICKRARLA